VGDAAVLWYGEWYQPWKESFSVMLEASATGKGLVSVFNVQYSVLGSRCSVGIKQQAARE
jgi:hypothetical protein